MSKKEITFSIVFPTYGAEEYLREAIGDIRRQVYERWELIIVDDASPDKSGAIADEYAAYDPRIRVVHKTDNEGVGPARNTGLAGATGDYVLFLDPDDRFEEQLLFCLAEEIDDYTKAYGVCPEVVAYGLTEDYYRGNVLSYEIKHHLPDGRYRGRDAIYPVLMEMEKETLYGYPWNKAFLNRFLNGKNKRFTSIPHIEDILFNIAVFDEVEEFSNMSRTPVHYRNKEISGHSRLTEKDIPDYFKLQKIRVRRLLKQYGKRKNALSKKEQKEALAIFAGEYARSYLSALEREIARGTGLSALMRYCRQEEGDVLYRKLLPHIDRRNRKLWLLYTPLRMGWYFFAIAEAWAIHTIKGRLPRIYNKAKQNR